MAEGRKTEMYQWIESKTYIVEAVNRVTNYDVRLELQVINGNIIIDQDARQIYHGSIEEYMEYSNYDLESVEEKQIDHEFEVIEPAAEIYSK